MHADNEKKNTVFNSGFHSSGDKCLVPKFEGVGQYKSKGQPRIKCT